jgi:hypothetical protein
LWIWIVLAVVFVGVPALVIASALLLRARASRAAFGRGASDGGHRHASHVTHYAIGGLAIGMLAGLMLVLDSRGGFAPLACAVGYLLGLLFGEFSAEPATSGSLRAAIVRARQPSDYVRPWIQLVIVIVAAFVLAAPIAYVLAPDIRYGSWHPVPGDRFTLPGGTTTWPGPLTTAAAALFAVLVLLLGAATLCRIAARPPLSVAADHLSDELLRRQSGRAVAGAVLGIELLVLAALLIAGSEGLAVPIAALAPAAYTGNRVMVWAGLCCALAAIPAWLALSGWIRRGRGAPAAAGPPAAAGA